MVRNILAVIAGLIIGSIVNMTLITVGPMLIPAPAGADVTTMEGLQAAIKMFEPKHFIFPFLAHALGTLIGAMVAAVIAASHKFTLAMAIGVLFLIGGIANVLLLSAPMWYNALDLVAAYIPMAWLGAKLGGATRSV